MSQAMLSFDWQDARSMINALMHPGNCLITKLVFRFTQMHVLMGLGDS